MVHRTGRTILQSASADLHRLIATRQTDRHSWALIRCSSAINTSRDHIQTVGQQIMITPPSFQTLQSAPMHAMRNCVCSIGTRALTGDAKVQEQPLSMPSSNRFGPIRFAVDMQTSLWLITQCDKQRSCVWPCPLTSSAASFNNVLLCQPTCQSSL